MNTYPQELVTPPLALVALLGCPQLHSKIGEYLRSQHRPPINSLGVTEPWAAGRLFGERKGMLTAPSERNGILKAGWFAKHRKRRPAVAVLFLERKNVVGDKDSWATSCSAMEAVKNAARARSAKMLVIIVGGNDELPEERAGAIGRISGIDKKYIFPFNPDDGPGSLKALGKILYEAAGQFYLDSARRQLLMHSERRGMTPERNARVNFKAAALAEFRADWATAVKTYQSAYAEITRVSLGTEFPLQRAFEISAVAEQIHIKIITLLLHQQRLPEAIAQFKTHVGLFCQLPFESPPAFAAAHWGWVARQYTVMGELMAARNEASALQGDANPMHLFLWAAQAAIKRREYSELALKMREGSQPEALDTKVSPGEYVGQFVATNPTRHLSDDEFIHILEVQEAATNQGKLAVEALSIAQEVCGQMSGKTSRQALFIGRLLAREHIGLRDYEAALRLLLPITGSYRREGWTVPLAGVIQELTECAHKLGYFQEEILHSLELACLDHGLEVVKRQKIAEGALQSLTNRINEGESSEQEQTISKLNVSKLNHPLHSCFHIQAGFEALPESTILPKTLHFGLKITSLLPVDLPVQNVKVDVRSTLSNSNRTMDLLPSFESLTCIGANSSANWCGECEAIPGETLSLTEISLQISPHAILAWNQDGLPGAEFGQALPSKLSSVRGQINFQPGLFESTVPLTLEPPKIEISSDPFAIIGETMLAQLEIFATIRLENPVIKVFGGFMEGNQPLAISITPTEGARWTSAERNTDDESFNPREVFLGTIDIEDVSKGSIKVVEVQIPVEKSGQMRLAAQLEYRGQDKEGSEEVSTSVEIEAIKPFEISAEFCTEPQTTALILPSSEDKSGVTSLPINSACHVIANLRLQTPTQIQIQTVDVSSVEGLDVRILGPKPSQGNKGFILRKADVLTAIFGLTGKLKMQFESAGNVIIRWKRVRRSEEDLQIIETRLPLPPINIVQPELEIGTEVEGQSSVGIPFPVQIIVRNRTKLLQQIKLAVNEAQGFVIAGTRHAVLNILPGQKYVHNLTLVACQAGFLVLPQCRILSTRYNALVEPLSDQRILISPDYKVSEQT